MIKVTHLWASDSPITGGGGAGSMYRLHNNIRNLGFDSRILCDHKNNGGQNIEIKPSINKTERLIRKLTSKLGLNDIHRVSSFKIKQHESFKESDIIHFHGIHSGFISYLAMPSLTANKTAVFTLRDMWCITGHCSYSYDCERWKHGCGKCPYPEVHPLIHRDGTHIEWFLKNRAISRSNLIFVSPSKWLINLAKESMINNHQIKLIPNGVCTDIYRPLDTDTCRNLLGIPVKKNVLMFASVNLKAYRKGGDLLIKALKGLPSSLKSETILIVLGNEGSYISSNVGIRTLDLGYISNDQMKSIAYAAADLFILPTRADNLPLVLQESLACGTPMVSFRVGGVPDLVRHGITGYLAEPENCSELREGIIQLLCDKSFCGKLSENCRTIALNEFSSALETRRYIELYQQILKN